MTPTPDPTLTLEHVRTLLEAATPGPWAWRGEPNRRDTVPKHPYLRSEIGPRYIVMDFVRQGMNSAQVRFRTRSEDLSIMRPVSEIGVGWEQHPDAALIAAAPDLAHLALDLAAALAEARGELTRVRGALEWYQEQAAGCRKVTSEGDEARRLLDCDGGHRARAALEPGA